jgi:tetratricopeptide (TPR) repeat protein
MPAEGPVEDGMEARLDRLRDSASKVKATTGNDIESRLQRAMAYTALEELRVAQKEYEAARDMAPQDARPLVGLAQLSVLPRGPAFAGAQRVSAPLIEKAQTLFKPARTMGPHDAEYLEMATGLQAFQVMYAPDSGKREAIGALEAILQGLGPQDEEEGRADAVHYFLKLVRPALDSQPLVPGFARCHADLKDVVKVHPKSVLVAEMRMGCSLFTERREDAVADAIAPLPAKSTPHYRIRQVQTLVALAAKFSAPELLDRIPDLVGKIRTGDAQELAALDAVHGDAVALEATLRHRDNLWPEVERAYLRALKRAPPAEEQARLLTNLGSVQFRLGKTDDADESWNRAEESQPELQNRVRFTEITTNGEIDETPATLNELEDLKTDPVFGESWRIWRTITAQRAKDTAGAADAARDVLAYRKENLRAGAAAGLTGAVADRTFVVNLGWQFQYDRVPEGAHWLAEIGIIPVIYLTSPPPMTLPQIEALAASPEPQALGR